MGSANSNDAPSFGLALLGFLIPLAGLIVYLVMQNDNPQKARSAGKGALWGVGSGFVIAFLTIGLLTVLGGRVASSMNSPETAALRASVQSTLTQTIQAKGINATCTNVMLIGPIGDTYSGAATYSDGTSAPITVKVDAATGRWTLQNVQQNPTR
jgi:hypothetical protein